MQLSYQYIAGFLEADGCISCSLVKSSKRGGKINLAPHVGVYNQNLEVLLSIMETMQCGEILACRTKGGTGGYRWDVLIADIKEVLNTLMPFLYIKRKQAEMMLAILKTRRGKVGPKFLPQSVIDERCVLVSELQRLNHIDSQEYRAKWVNSGKLSYKSCYLVRRHETILSQAEVPAVSSEGAETSSVSGNNNRNHERPLPKGNDIVRTIQ